jgi:Cd2+/Zn2+-exporting ATPase/Cu+-exporting ATPase
MAHEKTIDVPIEGMDCVECTQHVAAAIERLQGVEGVEVFLAAKKARVVLDPTQADLAAVRQAVASAGYSVPIQESQPTSPPPLVDFSRRIMVLFGAVFAAVLVIIVVGEWLGLLEAVTDRIPWYIALAIVLVGGFPVFRKVWLAILQRRITTHALMTVGVIAAVTIGEWATAAIVVFFMRVGDYVEGFTTDRSRMALRDLENMAPDQARVQRNGKEYELPISEIEVGEMVIVRPGEKIPVDGIVIDGHAMVDQSTVTGESMPIDAGAGARVFAATLAHQGSLRVEVTHVGAQSTFGRVIKLVEEAEANRASVERIADRFSSYFLPLVAIIAVLTYLISRDPMATVAVLVVACSCSFALATPIALLASIGASAKRGLLIKGGRFLETLAGADVLLIDKTGTLTLGRPQITDVVAYGDEPIEQILTLAASAERYSEHPLAEAVRHAAVQRGLELHEPVEFKPLPGKGVQAQINGSIISVGNQSMHGGPPDDQRAIDLAAEGKTLLYVMRGSTLIGLLAATDTMREEVPAAISKVRNLGLKDIELLTGDSERSAMPLADALGLPFRAGLLPEDKISIVRDYQSRGRTVVMIGDGVNDAPALAQADVGISMGAAGIDVAIEASHVALMREDWMLVPELLHIAKRTMDVVKVNLALAAIYNLAGLLLAAFGLLPPVVAAAAQSIPDLGILTNSSRLLRQR